MPTAFGYDLWVRFFKCFLGQIGFIRHIQECSKLHSGCLTLSKRRDITLIAINVIFRCFSGPQWFWTHIDELSYQYQFGLDDMPILKQIEDFILSKKFYKRLSTK